MLKTFGRTAAVAAALLAVGLVTGGCERAVRSYLEQNPDVLIAANEDYQRKMIADERARVEAQIPQFRDALERDPRDPVYNPDGEITVVEFFDYNCGFCRRSMPEIMDLMEQNDDIRFVFKEYPILSEESRVAAALALGVDDPDAYFELHQRFYATQQLTGSEIGRAVEDVGLDPDALAEAASTPEIARQLQDIGALARTLGVDGTPTFVVGNRMVIGADIEALKAAIEEARRAA